MIRQMIENGLVSALNRLGTGWKTIVGLSSMLAILIASQLDWLTPEQTDWAYKTAVTLFGFGIFHKIKTGQRGTSPGPTEQRCQT